MKISNLIFLAALLLVPGLVSAEDKSIAPNGPASPIPDPFPRTIIAAKPGTKAVAGQVNRRTSVGRAMLASAGDLLSGEKPASGSVWVTNLVAGFNQAMSEKKPMLAVFWFTGSSWSEKLIGEIEQAAILPQLAKCSVPVKIDIDLDDGAQNVKQMVANLGLTEYPVTVLLLPSNEKIQSVGQVNGYFTWNEFRPQLEELFKLAVNGPDASPGMSPMAEACRAQLAR